MDDRYTDIEPGARSAAPGCYGLYVDAAPAEYLFKPYSRLSEACSRCGVVLALPGGGTRLGLGFEAVDDVPAHAYCARCTSRMFRRLAMLLDAE